MEHKIAPMTAEQIEAEQAKNQGPTDQDVARIMGLKKQLKQKSKNELIMTVLQLTVALEHAHQVLNQISETQKAQEAESKDA